MNFIKYWIHRIKFIFKYHWDGYGKSGFTQLYYRGIPIILRDDIPVGKMLLRSKDGKWKMIHIPMRRKGKLSSTK